MFDKDDFNGPGYGPGGGDYYGPGGDEGYGGGGGSKVDLSGVGKILPGIILLIVIAGVAYFAFTWLNSQSDISISIVDAQGDPVMARLILKDSTQKTIPVTPLGDSEQFNAKVWPGDYRASVSANGYLSTTKAISVSSENRVFKITISRDVKVTLNAQTASTDLYEGQSLIGQIQVSNSGTAEIPSTDIVATVTGPIDVRVQTANAPVIQSGGNVILDFNVNVKSATALKTKQAATITFKVKGSSIGSDPITIQVVPAISESKVTVSGTLSDTQLIAGKEKSIPLQVRNGSNDSQLKNVQIEIIPDADSTDLISWMSLADSTPESKYKKVIDSIDPSQSVNVTLYVKPTFNAAKGDSFKGTLRVTSSSMVGEKSLPINFIIGSVSTVGLQFVMRGNPFTIQCSSSLGTCQTKTLTTDDVYLENTGDVDIQNIRVQIDFLNPVTTTNCTSYVTKFFTAQYSATENANDKITLLKAKSKAGMVVDITAPADAADSDTARCAVRVTYPDPFTGTAQELPQPYVINLTKRVI